MLKFGCLALIGVFASVSLGTAAPSPELVQRWQKAAVQKHPALAKSGTPLNERFLAIVAEKRKSEPAFFDRADWPMRAAELAAEAVKADEAAAKAKEKEEMARTAEDRAKAEEIAQWEKEWERDKEKWLFERLVFGDTDETILRKLSLSKLLTQRVPPGARAALGSRFRWEMGESNIDLDFEGENALSAIVFRSLPQDAGDLADFVHEDWNKIRTAAIERFGQPAKSAEYPTAEKLSKGGLTLTDEWARPGSRTTLGVAEDGGQCRVILRIDKAAAPAK